MAFHYPIGGGGGDPTIGNPVIGGTPNLVLFVDSSGNLAQSTDFLFSPTQYTVSRPTPASMGVGTENIGVFSITGIGGINGINFEHYFEGSGIAYTQDFVAGQVDSTGAPITLMRSFNTDNGDSAEVLLHNQEFFGGFNQTANGWRNGLSANDSEISILGNDTTAGEWGYVNIDTTTGEYIQQNPLNSQIFVNSNSYPPTGRAFVGATVEIAPDRFLRSGIHNNGTIVNSVGFATTTVLEELSGSVGHKVTLSDTSNGLVSTQVFFDSGTPKIRSIANDNVDISIFDQTSTEFAFDQQVKLTKTITPTGTTGDQTINTQTGSVNFAAGMSTVTVTNSLVDANSVIIPSVGDDLTMDGVSVTRTSGSFTLTAKPNLPTAETRVDFIIIN